MAVIVPRWEWRTFGKRFGSAEAAFAAMPSTGSVDSDELYLLSPAGDNVKVRDDLLDIKVLEEIDADGLERWMPVMKAEFPLSVVDVAPVFGALGVATPRPTRDRYSIDQLLDELAELNAGVRAVDVHKHRVRYVVEGCAAELTDVIVDGHQTRTIAVESEDKAAVLGAVGVLGLDGYLNTNYLVGLAQVLDGAPARYAVIDVGTNSVKFHLGERANNGLWTTLVDRADLTRLGEDLDTKGVSAPRRWKGRRQRL